MDMFILETLNFVVDILKVPSVLVGLIALIGLVAQKKSFSDVVKGTIKTILGFIVLGGGATVLVGSLNPLGGMFEHAFNIQGIIPNNEAIVSIALEKYGASTALIMAFGMVANIVVARFTRLKYIFLTGHHTFYMACMIGVILTVAGFEGVGLVFTGSLILGLVMAFFPALALGIEKGEADLMKRKPRNPKDGIFAGGLGIDVVYQGVLVSALTVLAFLIGNYFEHGVWSLFNADSGHGITMAFLTMSMAEIFHSFNMRSQRGSIFKLKTQNGILWGAGALSLILTTLVIEVPFLADAFDFVAIGLKEYVIALGLAFAVIPIVEIVKLIQRSLAKKK